MNFEARRREGTERVRILVAEHHQKK